MPMVVLPEVDFTSPAGLLTILANYQSFNHLCQSGEEDSDI